MSNKEKDQFKKRFKAFLIEEAELERMFKQEELRIRAFEVNEAAFQAAMANEAGYGVGGGGSQTTISSIEGSASIHFFINAADNIAFVVMNYTLGVLSEAYDTGIAYDGGNSYISTSGRNIHNGGFQVLFYDSPNARVHAFFINNVGEVVDQIYTGGGYSESQLEMFLTFFADYEPDGSPTYTILKLFDGYSTTTLEIDGVTSVNWQSQPTSQKVAVFEYNSEFHLIGMNGQNVKIHDQTSAETLDIRSQYTHSYVCGLIYDTTDSNLYKRFKAWSSDGTVIADVDISSYNVDNVYDSELYGDDNRYCAVIFNGGDSDVDYLVIHFDGENVVIDTHAKGDNYPNVEVYTTDLEKWNPANSMKTNATIFFYKGGVHTVAPGFSEAEYFDAWCMHHSLQSFTKETIITNGQIGFDFGTNQEEGAAYSGDPFFLYYDLADSPKEVQAGAFTSSGFNSFGLDIDADDIQSISSTESIAPDHAFFNVNLTSSPTVRNWVIFNSQGTVIKHNTSTNTDPGGGPMYNALVVLDLNDFANSFSFSPTQGKDLLPDPGADTYDILAYNEIENEFGTSSGYSTSNVIVTKYTSGDLIGFYIYNNTAGLSSFVTLPTYDSVETFLMGETVVYFGYYDSVDSYYKAIIYDIENGSEISTLSTDNLSPTAGGANYGDRIWESFDIEGVAHYYFLCRGGSFTAELGTNVLGNAYNDAYWVDDY